MGGMTVAALYFAVAMRNLPKPVEPAHAGVPEEGVALKEVRARAESDPEVDTQAHTHVDEAAYANAIVNAHADAEVYAAVHTPDAGTHVMKHVIEMRDLPAQPASP
jgi:hypothetical protein